jgi:hypothetical protein
VIVTLPDGKPVNKPVELRDNTGAILDRVTPVEGHVRLCDLGFGAHSIEIGDENECDHLSIRNVVDAWPHPRIIKAVFNPSCGAESLVRPAGCYVALRITDVRGVPVPEVRLDGYGPQLRSDLYGRIWLVLKWDDPAHVTLANPRFYSEAVDLRCTKPQQRLELHVTLKARNDR